MRRAVAFILVLAVAAFAYPAVVSAQILRVATYNVNADTSGSDSCSPSVIGCPSGGPGLADVLKAIGQSKLAGHAQPLDVLALEELSTTVTTPPTGTPSATIDFILGQMNAFFPGANYKADITTDPTTGGTGGGPSGLIYNANTIQLLGNGVAVGSTSGSGAARAPMRYELAPKDFNNHTADFYVYVSHMKSGDAAGVSNSTTNGARRDVEATTIRNNAATLGANAHIIYTGDLNLNDSTEAAYQTLIGAGTGQAIDTLAAQPRGANPANFWDPSNSTYKDLLTESATSVRYRDDFQLVTSPMLTQPGMQLVNGTLGAYGNGGGIFRQSVTNTANSTAPHIALPDLANRTTILSELTTATDHLPIVADYSFASVIIPGDYDHSGTVNAADYTLWQSSFGSTTSLAADGNADGVVDAADYSVWRDHLGNHIPPGAGAGAWRPFPNQALLCCSRWASVSPAFGPVN